MITRHRLLLTMLTLAAALCLAGTAFAQNKGAEANEKAWNPLGPNAVLALSREGYTWRDVRARDVLDTLRFPGFRTLARRHARQGLEEVVRSVWRPLFLRSLQELVPELTAADLLPAPAGVRAQAVGPDGALVDDFLIVERPGALHVLNAPSPAATSSLEIGAEIARRLSTL